MPKGGLEPPRSISTAPSRQRVYQFHHFGMYDQSPGSALNWLVIVWYPLPVLAPQQVA